MLKQSVRLRAIAAGVQAGWGASPSGGVPRCCAYAATQSVHSAWRPVTFTLSGRAFLSSCDITTLPVRRFLTP